MAGELTVRAGKELTVTVATWVLVQPLSAVPVTVYAVELLNTGVVTVAAFGRPPVQV